MPYREYTTDISDLDLFPACAVTTAMARAAVEQPSKATERDSPEKVVNPAPDSNAQAIEVPSSAKELSSQVIDNDELLSRDTLIKEQERDEEI